jgi:hypothetical protein
MSMFGWFTTCALLIGGDLPLDDRSAVGVPAETKPVIQLHRASRTNSPSLCADDDDDDGDDDSDKDETVRIKKDTSEIVLDVFVGVRFDRRPASALRRARIPSPLPLFLSLCHLRN